MDFDALFAKVCEALQRERRISYRALRRRFDLSADDLEDLKVEMVEAKQLAVDENDSILVWAGEKGSASTLTTATSTPASTTPPTPPAPDREPLSYTPPHLAEKILTSHSALEGER